jgi:hypothetical protein
MYDSGRSTAAGIRAYRASRQDQNDAVIGAWDSEVSQVLATVAKVDQIPMCSFASSSQILADKTQHPYFSRTVGSDKLTASVVPKVIKAFGWESIALIHSEDAYASQYAHEIHLSTSMQSVTVEVTATYGCVAWARLAKLLSDERAVPPILHLAHRMPAFSRRLHNDCCDAPRTQHTLRAIYTRRVLHNHTIIE